MRIKPQSRKGRQENRAASSRTSLLRGGNSSLIEFDKGLLQPSAGGNRNDSYAILSFQFPALFPG
jgi:hypothetical protein